MKRTYFQPEMMISSVAATNILMASGGGASGSQSTPISGDPGDAI